MKKIMLVWGWTGWHITPLVSLYNHMTENFRESAIEFLWIGEKDSMEQRIAQEKNIRFYWIKAWKLRRYFSLKTLIEPFNIILWIIESARIIKSEKPALIFSKWWFVSLPVALAAKLTWTELYLHESDTIPWLANRFVGKFASRVYLGFEEAGKYFNAEKVNIVWQILNPELLRTEDKKKLLRTENWEIRAEDRKTNLLIIAWSQGSTRIFKMILDNMDSFSDFNIDVVLWSLNKYLKPEFEKFSNVTVYEFLSQEKIGKILEKTDIAITRAWATSLAELEAFWIKMLIIPLKESANDHQFYNAVAYSDKWEIMIEETDLSTIPELINTFKNFKKTPHQIPLCGALEIIASDLI
ncbi:MAG: undecaprenyldiphospho-muramoylpentapeptide beta-N-acetylglucosaminyltransferase [uncultured bacterium (gcode 4)]|uniref:Undecaprenyldiphospho-muramoylpentapeptide beta-N-acetylglucosaminyltransferase n=1 Tax=uncultured bacterium (gcode 4) TaxID=1234023 RepID=K2G0W4_9BACT|nr:MAG: undecaprenyldiphospho-muramoylpentapeptide beta-N-acetylglucosaminyltransferase [uncultured bacterium (gcode 4)]